MVLICWLNQTTFYVKVVGFNPTSQTIKVFLYHKNYTRKLIICFFRQTNFKTSLLRCLPSIWFFFEQFKKYRLVSHKQFWHTILWKKDIKRKKLDIKIMIFSKFCCYISKSFQTPGLNEEFQSQPSLNRHLWERISRKN